MLTPVDYAHPLEGIKSRFSVLKCPLCRFRSHYKPKIGNLSRSTGILQCNRHEKYLVFGPPRKKSISYNTTGYTNGGLICPISECGLLYGWRKKAKWQLKYTGVKTKMENVHCHNHWYNHDKGCNNLSPKVTKFSLSALLVLLYIN